MNEPPDLNGPPGRRSSPAILPAWYWLLIPGAVLLFQLLTAPFGVAQIPYSDFKQALRAGKVSELVVAEQTLSGTLQRGGLEQVLARPALEQLGCGVDQPCRFSSVRVSDPALVAELDKAGVRYAGQTASAWPALLLSALLPLLLIMWMAGALARRSGMPSGWLLDIGKSGARMHVASRTGVTFDDVAGIDEAREELMEVVAFLKNPARYRALGGKIPKGVLIVGAPGTGKTLLAKAVAGEAGVPFFSISGAEFVEMFVGVGAARVRDLFKQAEDKAPCIIFIDELDALGRARGVAGAAGGAFSEHEHTLNQLLVEMDGFETNKGVIVLAATNRPEILDPALLRPGRFDRHVALERPDLKGREQILRVHANTVKLADAIDLAAVAARTAGFAGADLANLVNEAALLAGRQGKLAVGMDDIDEAIDRIVAGLKKITRVLGRKEKELVACHEAGHALIAELRAGADKVAKVSIIARGVATLGYTQQLPAEERYLARRSELLDRLDVFLGGRTAEELVFGDVSTGAQNDLQQATDLARQMVTRYGMSEQLGVLALESLPAPYMPLPAPAARSEMSEATAQLVDAEVARLLDQAHGRVRETLHAERTLLDALAAALLERETIYRAGLDALLAAHRAAHLAALGQPVGAGA